MAAATHTRVATALGAGNWRAGMGGGVHVRGHACGQPCGLAISPLELTSAVDHGWIARWANNLGHVLA